MSANADHEAVGSAALRSGELTAVSAKFAEGYARLREVTDTDGAWSACAKARAMAAAAATRGQHELARQELGRSRELGAPLVEARGAALVVLISRGEAAYTSFTEAIDAAYGASIVVPAGAGPSFDVDADAATEHFAAYFGSVPGYVELLAEAAPRALEGYTLMREWSLGENVLAPVEVELLLCTVNAADFSGRFVAVHAAAARRAGASEAAIVEAALCAIPISGAATWIVASEAILDGRPGS